MQMPHSDLTSSSYNEVQFIISACVALWNSCALILTLDLQLSLRTVKIFSAHEWKTLGNAFSWTYMLQKKIISELLPALQVERGFSYTFCKRLRPTGDDLSSFCSSVALTMKHGENGFMKRQYCFHFWLLKKNIVVFLISDCDYAKPHVPGAIGKGLGWMLKWWSRGFFLYQHWCWWYQVSSSTTPLT